MRITNFSRLMIVVLICLDSIGFAESRVLNAQQGTMYNSQNVTVKKNIFLEPILLNQQEEQNLKSRAKLFPGAADEGDLEVQSILPPVQRKYLELEETTGAHD